MSGSGLLGWLSRLRSWQLFVVAGALFVVDLLVPDPIPFIDEIMQLFEPLEFVGVLGVAHLAAVDHVQVQEHHIPAHDGAQDARLGPGLVLGKARKDVLYTDLGEDRHAVVGFLPDHGA